MTLAVLPTVPDLSVRSATTRLAQEFPELGPPIDRPRRPHLPRGAARLARRTRCPELVERLARQRLRVSLP